MRFPAEVARRRQSFLWSHLPPAALHPKGASSLVIVSRVLVSVQSVDLYEHLGVILLVPVQLMDQYEHLDADATALARRP